MIRRVINIDEDKCNGCGICVNACHEGAIGLVDGKAKLMRDDYCDGLGDCLPTCPTGAITFVEREAVPYDEAAVMENKKKKQQGNNNNSNNNAGNNNIQSNNTGNTSSNNDIGNSGHAAAHVHSGCPGSMMRSLRNRNANDSVSENDGIAHNSIANATTTDGHTAFSNDQSTPCSIQSRLENWPVQIKLAPVNAPYFKNAKLLIAADCTAYAYAGFHDKFIKDKITLIGCPKLDSTDYSEKLSEILRYNDIKSVTVVRMEVPCCGGLAHAAMEALRKSDKMIPWNVVTISLDGRIIDE